MKILAISDVEVPGFYEYYTPGVFDEYDLILACGDLKKRYLEFFCFSRKSDRQKGRGWEGDA